MRTAGYQGTTDPAAADVLIVNTCGFIQPARDESIQVLKDYAREKKEGQFLVAAGCMSEREKDHLGRLVPGLDAALSTRRWSEIARVLKSLGEGAGSPYFYFPETEAILTGPDGLNQFAVQGKSAYLKVADGCDRRCAYCAIPNIKGPMVSRSIEKVIADARVLARMGMQEIVLIAQDTTAYGRDLGLKNGLVKLLDEMTRAVPAVPWLRIMYTFPGAITDELVALMAERDQILPYLDLPLQHAHPDVLRRMKRPSDIEDVRRTLEKMRAKMPDICLRTTFIAGYPGETQAEFDFLVSFLKEIEFDHVGIFPYYHEAGTASFSLQDTVPESEKNARMARLAEIQEGISLKRNEAQIGKTFDVLVEDVSEHVSIARSYRDAPDVDGLIFINEIVKPGSFLKIKITGALVHDLIAELA